LREFLTLIEANRERIDKWSWRMNSDTATVTDPVVNPLLPELLAASGRVLMHRRMREAAERTRTRDIC
jgi:hypothetical protein